ncbi:MAG TPA: acylphosphatase [Candidatus Paceibacterota bacterium]|nr:acylphosphatase [Candidatus Paceibacterota bacterium]
MEEFRAIVSGRVQMVTYRAFVEKHARHLALTGYVRNLTNGTVEVVAQGYEDSLQKLLEYIRKGPFLATVSNVEVEWRQPTKEYGRFEIIY